MLVRGVLGLWADVLVNAARCWSLQIRSWSLLPWDPEDIVEKKGGVLGRSRITLQRRRAWV